MGVASLNSPPDLRVLRKVAGIMQLRQLALSAFVLGSSLSLAGGNALAIRGEDAIQELETPYEVPGFTRSVQKQLAKQPSWQGFRSVAGDWSAQFDEVTGRVFHAQGPALQLLSPSVASRIDFEQAALDFVDARPALFGISAAELEPVRTESVGADTTWVLLQQMHDGLPVKGAVATLRFSGGALVSFTATTHPADRVEPFALTADEATDVAWSQLDAVHPLAMTEAPYRVIYPARVANGYQLRPAWVMQIETGNPVARFETVVDAVNGEVLERRNKIYYATIQLTAQVEARTVGDPLVKVALPHTQSTGGLLTDADGRAETTSTSLTAQLLGSLFSLDDVSGTETTRSFNINGVAPIEELFWDATGEPIEQLDSYYYALKINEAGRFHTPNLGWLQQQLPVNINLNDTCNAYFDGSSLNFFLAGNGCNNTGRIYDVVAHEWGHGFHFNRSVQGINGPEIQEGVADFIAASSTNDPRIGPNFLTSGAPVRNIEPNRVYPQDFVGDSSTVHADGLIWGGAWWDLRKLLIDKYGYAEGVYIVDQLHSETLAGGPRVTTGYDDALASDDDDGNTTNGTPNSCEINSAFGDHGLIQSTAAPTLGYVRFDFPVLGTPYPEGVDIEVRSGVTSGAPQCGALDPSSVTLHYSLDGGESFTTLPMTNDGTDYVATIPAPPDGSAVSYYLSARTDGSSIEWTEPRHAPETLHAFSVGDAVPMRSWDFEDGIGDWTHGADGSVIRDDWQVGTPMGKGWDPDHAYSGTNAVGTDLGQIGNGLYPDNTYNWLVGPNINCTACSNTRLRFRRWLNVEQGDAARIKVNGQVVWENGADQHAVHDGVWVYQDIDISEIADGNKDIQIAFELQSNTGGNFGGWNLDDIEVVSAAASGADFTALEGGCSCTLTGKRVPAGPLGGALLGVLAVLGIVARRRRC